jgi:hypothetical protein
MSFDWREYLDLARELAGGGRDLPKKPGCDLRSAVLTTHRTARHEPDIPLRLISSEASTRSFGTSFRGVQTRLAKKSAEKGIV